MSRRERRYPWVIQGFDWSCNGPVQAFVWIIVMAIACLTVIPGLILAIDLFIDIYRLGKE